MLRLLILVFLLLPTAANALTLTTYTSRRAFESAAGTNLTTIDFEGIAPAGGFVQSPFDLTVQGVHFQTWTDMFVVDPAYYPIGYDYGSGATFLGAPGFPTTITLPSPATSFGTDIMSILSDLSRFQLTVAGESVYSRATYYPGRAFMGVLSDVPFTSVTIAALDGWPQLDNVVYGSAAPVPEPASFLLLLLGLPLVKRCRH